jgi:hypothetical protein
VSDYVPVALRRLVADRAGGRCEYCGYPEEAALLTFEIEHIIARKHGGRTVEGNLAFACPFCNQAKGTDIASLDPDISLLTGLYNPRTQRWREHFSFDGRLIRGLTPAGRVTVALLQFNAPERLSERQDLHDAGIYENL